MDSSEVTIRMPRQARSVSIRDLCEPLLAFAIALRNTSDPGGADRVRETFERLRLRFQDQARAAQVDPAHIEHALFAMVALIDETVARSHPTLLDDWLSRPLQLEVFGDNNAGIHFFDRLHTLRGGVRREIRDLLEVFLVCLSLGFRGKFIGAAGVDQLQALRRELSTEILKMSGDEVPILSPHAVRVQSLPARVLQLPTWAIAAAAGVVVVVAYVVFRTLAAGSIDGLLGVLTGAERA